MRRRGGFTLMEVLIAMAIASTGIVLLFNGLTGVIVMERRGRFYDRVTAFCDQRLDPLIVAASGSGAAPLTAQPIDELEPAITVTIQPGSPGLEGASGTAVDLTQLQVTFRSADPALPISESLVTYHTGLLAVRKRSGGGAK